MGSAAGASERLRLGKQRTTRISDANRLSSSVTVLGIVALGRPHALGLVGMRERAAVFGGYVDISGIPGNGTTVVVRMPIGRPTNENSDR